MTRSYRLPSTIRIDSLAALFVSALPLVYFNAALRGTIVLASEDGILFNVPLRVAAANIVRSGNLPLWDPYIFSGIPLHAAAQGGLLFPLNWFFLFFDAPAATNLMALSAYMLAALGAYLYARRSGSSVAGAIVTSIIWQWCGFLIGQFSHVNIVQTAALLPWLLWAIDGFGKRGERKYAIVIAAIVMLQGFTGHQQTLVYSLLLATAYALVMWRAHRPERNFYVWSLVLFAAGMLLTAVQILPTYELMRNSLRSRTSFDFFTSFSLPPRFLLTFFAPYLFGGGDGRLFRVNYFGAPFYGEFIGYVSIAALMLTAIAIVLTRKDPRTKFWTAVAVIAFALALGRNWPFKSYAVVYLIPVLKAFRVPARHMLEVDFALAVLAGRGLTALARVADRRQRTRLALVVGLSAFLLTCLVVTLGRPSSFQLANRAPVTLLRAPELFIPIVFAGLSVLCLWRYARIQTTVRLFLILLVIAIDLSLWGQSSGWRVASPPPEGPVWSEPPPLALLRNVAASDSPPYRILTAPHVFDPAREVVGPMTSRSPDWVLWLQPDLYMMWGVENASGYDGFGLARYSRFAGDMAIWGELKNPDKSLRGTSRELDLLNVRYVMAQSAPPADEVHVSESSDKANAIAPVNSNQPRPALTLDRPTTQDLQLASIGKGSSITFEMPQVMVSRVILVSSLTWSTELSDGEPVAVLTLRSADGRKVNFDIRVGEHTSEWAYDRPDIRKQIKNRRAKVAASYRVSDAQGSFQGHTYVSEFKLPEPLAIAGGEIRMLELQAAPDLTMTVHQVSTADGNTIFPLRREWFSRRAVTRTVDPFDRWARIGEVDLVTIFENRRVLPRAWLASNAHVLKEDQILSVIQTGNLPDGTPWDPRSTVLLEAPVEFNRQVLEDTSANVTVKQNGPNNVQVSTKSMSPAILVLSENFFPGWYAYVDGKREEILRVNYNQRGLVLEQGEHNIEFVYRPFSVLLGFMISSVTALALVLWTWQPTFGKVLISKRKKR